jgi:ribonuclease Z
MFECYALALWLLLQVGRSMGAHRTILTHFSQRYPKLPDLANNAHISIHAAGACVAFDFMR